jgi:hypothetical protein
VWTHSSIGGIGLCETGINDCQFLVLYDTIAALDFQIDDFARNGRQQLHRAAGIGFHHPAQCQRALNFSCGDSPNYQRVAQR